MKSSEPIYNAKLEIGYTESPANSNMTKYGEWYGLNGQPWCVIFVQYCLRNSGLLKRTASSSDLANYFKSKGDFYTQNPKMGDVVFFNFGDKKHFANHVGLVERINSDGTIQTIEGNTSIKGSQDNGGMVCRKIRKAGIVGFGRPQYSDYNKSTTRPTLRVGSVGSDVKYLHSKLVALKYGVDAYSDRYTELTADCVKHFQAVNHLTIDGICGKDTWKAIDRV